MKNKRLFRLPSLYYTHGSAGSACAGAQAKKKITISTTKTRNLIFQ